MNQDCDEKKMHRKTILICYITLAISAGCIHILRFYDGIDDMVSPDMISTIVAYGAIITILVTLIYKHIRKAYSMHISEESFKYPITILGTVCTLGFILQVTEKTKSYQKKVVFENRHMISDYTYTTVVKNWEKDAIDHPELNPLYENIFGMSADNTGYFPTKEQWGKQAPHIPFVPFEDNPKQWHFAVQLCQEMVNTVRTFDLYNQKKIGTDTKKISKFDTLLTTFRVFMKNPTVRNVWELYRYHLANVYIDAWITYHITDFIDQNPDFMLSLDESKAKSDTIETYHKLVNKAYKTHYH